MDIQLYTVAIDSSKLSFQNGQWQQEKPWQMSIFFLGLYQGEFLSHKRHYLYKVFYFLSITIFK